MARIISLDDYRRLKQCHCDKGKHRFRENKFGVTWCVICGQLSINNRGLIEPLKEEDKLTIKIWNNTSVNELFKELSTIPEELRDSSIQISTDYWDLEKVEGVGIIANISLKDIKLSFY